MPTDHAHHPLTRDIFFFHVMKTAGTTVVRLLEAAYGPGANCALPTHEAADAGPFKARVADPSPCVVSGHPHHLHELWARALARDTPRRTMTFLRHPLERMLSCYDFIRRSNYVQRHVGRFDLSLEEALDSDDPRLAANMMTKVLASLGRPRDYAAPATEQDLALAIEHLQAMDMVGLVEEFEFSYALMAHTFGFAPTNVVPWNVNTRRQKAGDLPEALARRILADNALDLSLYTHGVKLFSRRADDARDALEALMGRFGTSDMVVHVKPY